MKDKEVPNPRSGKYRYTDSEGNIKEIELKDLYVKKSEQPALTVSNKATWDRDIVINIDSVTFRAGEFELKVTNPRLMDELKHTDKIIINGVSFIKEE